MNEDLEKLKNMTNEELIQLVLATKKENQELQTHVSNKKKIQKMENQKKDEKEKKMINVVDNTPQKKIALSLFYIGIDYSGFEKQQNSINTIEHHLFASLKKTMLIKEIATADYTRAGRTDKGVSAFSNILALKVRACEKNSKNSLNYLKMINSNLPFDIRVTAFSEVDDDFNARYHCIAREYRYYFVQDLLDIEKMREASKYYVGEHDFRNFCKIDPSNALDYKRNMLKIEIEEIKNNNDSFDPRMKMYCFLVKGSSFLWHQIRCMVEVLFLIGNGYEEGKVILELLDVEKNPRRPSYAYAADFPLVLSNCYYEKLEFKYKMENNLDLYEKLKERFLKKNIETVLYLSMMKYFANISINQYVNAQNTDTLLESLMKEEIARRKKRKNKSLMEKPAGNTLEEIISKLKGKDKEMYLSKLEKKIKYEENLENLKKNDNN